MEQKMFPDTTRPCDLVLDPAPRKWHGSDAAHAVTGCNGPLHVAKRFSLTMCSGVRKLRWGSVFVDIGCASKSIPVAAFVAQDGQSDRQSCQRMNPSSLPRSWDDWGMRLHSFIDCLLVHFGAGCRCSSR